MDKKISKEVFFCSAASRYFKEQLAGTAANSQVFILIEHSDPFPGKVADAHLNKQWLQSMQQLAKSLRGKVLLIRNKKTNYKDCKIIFVDCRQAKYFTIQTTIEKSATISLEADIESPQTVWETDPFFTICTNGKKDKCCAKFGYPVFKFFESFNADVNVWECTHVGGDRFAANVVCMPFGIYYGHVMVEDVGHIMVRSLLRKIYRYNFRGLSRRSFFEQAIECHLREHLHNYDIDFEMHTHLVKHEGDVYTVKIETQNGGHFIMVLQKVIIPYPHHLTCTSSRLENISKFELQSLHQLEAHQVPPTS